MKYIREFGNQKVEMTKEEVIAWGGRDAVRSIDLLGTFYVGGFKILKNPFYVLSNE